MPELREIFVGDHFGYADAILDNIVRAHREDELLSGWHGGRVFKMDVSGFVEGIGYPQITWSWTSEEEEKLPSKVTNLFLTAEQTVVWDDPLRELAPGEPTVASYFEYSKKIIINNLKSGTAVYQILPELASARLDSFQLVDLGAVPIEDDFSVLRAVMAVRFEVKVRTFTREKR